MRDRKKDGVAKGIIPKLETVRKRALEGRKLEDRMESFVSISRGDDNNFLTQIHFDYHNILECSVHIGGGPE